MNRLVTSIVGALALTQLVHAHFARATEAQPRPNILYIFADDQSYRSIGCYGYQPWSWVRTPNIDRLANEGVRFSQAYLGPSCLPSRLMVLTGLHPHAIQGIDPSPGTKLDPQLCRFWPAELRKHGYHTAQIGKWHPDGYGELNLWGRDWDHAVAWDHPDNSGEGNGGYYGEEIPGAGKRSAGRNQTVASPDNSQRLTINGITQRVKGYPRTTTRSTPLSTSGATIANLGSCGSATAPRTPLIFLTLGIAIATAMCRCPFQRTCLALVRTRPV
jgi:hypothetical protein